MMGEKAVLVAHRDSSRVPEAAVRAIPGPASTASWRPYSHGEILNALEAACLGRKWLAIRKEYSMTASGSRMFGVWEFGCEDSELNFALGFRNSIDKHFAVGLCAGERVFVCDNLVFEGDFVIFRKHSGLFSMEELMLIAGEALGEVMGRFENLRDWHNSLKRGPLSSQEAALLTMAAMRKGLLSPSYFPRFQDLYFGSYSPSLHGWHGALTEVFKSNSSILAIQEKNAELGAFLRYEAPLLLAHGGDGRIDFKALEEEAAFQQAAILNFRAAETSERALGIREKVQRELRNSRNS